MPPPDEHLRFLDEKLAGYRIGAMAHAGALEFEIAANWKFAHENFIEPYHVFAAHPHHLRLAGPPRLHGRDLQQAAMTAVLTSWEVVPGRRFSSTASNIEFAASECARSCRQGGPTDRVRNSGPA